VDVAETLAISRAKSTGAACELQLGASASAASRARAADQPGDRILGLELSPRGHLTHGMKLNFSGKLTRPTPVSTRSRSLIDLDMVREKALETRPRAHRRLERLSATARLPPSAPSPTRWVATLWVDMAHFAGLVAAGVHLSPVPHAHVTSSTVHKTIGDRSGFILNNDLELQKKINSNVFPGQGRASHARDRGEGDGLQARCRANSRSARSAPYVGPDPRGASCRSRRGRYRRDQRVCSTDITSCSSTCKRAIHGQGRGRASCIRSASR
jgi:glycine/serine hydroxymethyltransferase